MTRAEIKHITTGFLMIMQGIEETFDALNKGQETILKEIEHMRKELADDQARKPKEPG